MIIDKDNRRVISQIYEVKEESKLVSELHPRKFEVHCARKHGNVTSRRWSELSGNRRRAVLKTRQDKKR